MRLNKATTHAIHLLVACARSQGQPMNLIKVAELSEQLELTPQNTFKIVHLLTRSGFLKATRGRYGGVQLAHAAAAIGVGDVVRAIEALSSEATGEPVAPGIDPGQAALFGDAFESFIGVLNQASIADLARAKRPAPKVRSGHVAKAAPKASKTVKAAAAGQPRRSGAILR
jgi:Rrf2 family nitric oxide-sensitive transcriptional repressor